MEPRRASLIKIIWGDYSSFLAAISMVVTAGFLVYDQFTQQLGLGETLIFITIAVWVAGIALILWRVRHISSVFEFGFEVEADITDIGFFRDRGRVTYVFTIQGERYQVSNAIMKTAFTRSLQRGQKIKVISHRDNPKSAFIRDLYS